MRIKSTNWACFPSQLSGPLSLIDHVVLRGTADILQIPHLKLKTDTVLYKNFIDVCISALKVHTAPVFSTAMTYLH